MACLHLHLLLRLRPPARLPCSPTPLLVVVDHHLRRSAALRHWVSTARPRATFSFSPCSGRSRRAPVVAKAEGAHALAEHLHVLEPAHTREPCAPARLLHHARTPHVPVAPPEPGRRRPLFVAVVPCHRCLKTLNLGFRQVQLTPADPLLRPLKHLSVNDPKLAQLVAVPLLARSVPGSIPGRSNKPTFFPLLHLWLTSGPQDPPVIPSV